MLPFPQHEYTDSPAVDQERHNLFWARVRRVAELRRLGLHSPSASPQVVATADLLLALDGVDVLGVPA